MLVFTTFHIKAPIWTVVLINSVETLYLCQKKMFIFSLLSSLIAYI